MVNHLRTQSRLVSNECIEFVFDTDHSQITTNNQAIGREIQCIKMCLSSK